VATVVVYKTSTTLEGMDGGEHKEATREDASTSCETPIYSFRYLYIN
jgi:hypothetical protein